MYMGASFMYDTPAVDVVTEGPQHLRQVQIAIMYLIDTMSKAHMIEYPCGQTRFTIRIMSTCYEEMTDMEVRAGARVFEFIRSVFYPMLKAHVSSWDIMKSRAFEAQVVSLIAQIRSRAPL